MPLNVLQSLDAPSVPFDSAEEDLRDEIQSIVSGLLGLVRVEADPLQSPPAVFLANLIEQAWRAGKGFDLEGLIGAIADPPFDKIGALPLETAFPRKDRQGLMMALNNLLASPSFEAWRRGEPLDVARMLRAPDGRPRLSIVSTAHLADEERLFVTALLLDKVKTWMRRQGGTTELRAARLHGRDLRLLPAAPGQPADQAAAAHPAEAGARAGRGRGARHPEPRGPRLQGPRQHGHLDGGDAADRSRTASGSRAACRARASSRRPWRGCSPARRSASSCCTTCTARRPACCSRAGPCPTCAGRSPARRSRGS